MLQARQLDDVSRLYRDEIAELHEFLSAAELHPGTADALSNLMLRLTRDRAFRRDMTLHVWVVMERYGEQVSYTDLLGIIAMAAAGVQFAAEADGRDARELLRFLMEASSSLHARSPRPASSSEVSGKADGQRQQLRPRGSANDHRPKVHVAPSSAWDREFQPKRRRPALLIAATGCMCAALFGVYRFHHGSETSTRPGGALAANRSPLDRLRALPEEAASSTGNGHFPCAFTATTCSGSLPSAPQQIRPRSQPAPAHRSIEAPQVGPAPVVRVAAKEATAAPIPYTQPASAPQASRLQPTPTRREPVPTAVLSRLLGARSLPAYDEAGSNGNAAGQTYPQLLRRRSLSGTGLDTVALNQPGSRGAFNTDRTAPDSFARGVVHPTSLGIMAGNVVYSPAPAYPSAASAAHVQGEVKVQAEIDRDGNVASLRVISGPPLLRDAAADAVQRWRYKPYVSAGKAVPMSAVAVLDFQMP
ncbi:MAG: energy transducer TonB [Janthinobacterium lividum]